MKLEIACFNLRAALIAHENMADRIELCSDISVGGLTPEYDTVTAARTKLSVDLFVMIRPRGGDFVYSDSEFKQMKKDIIKLKKMRVDGFVFGIINDNKTVNKKQNKELVKLSAPLPCTFHRAFDEVSNPRQALEDIVECGFKTILTSGQKSTAVDGINLLTELIHKAENRIVIMPGGGVRSSNISLLKNKIDTAYFHSSAIIGSGEYPNVKELQLLRKRLNEK